MKKVKKSSLKIGIILLISLITTNKILAYCGFTMPIAISPKADYIAIGNYNNATIELWSTNNRLIKTIPGFYICSLTFDNKGKYIVAGTSEKSINIWDTNGNLIREVYVETGIVEKITFSPDNKKMAFLSDDNLFIWDREYSFKEFKNSLQYFCNFAFSPDSRFIIVSDIYNKLILWNINTDTRSIFSNKNNSEFSELSKKISFLAFSPNNIDIACGTEDGIIQIWNINGELKNEFEVSKYEVDYLMFTSNNNLISINFIKNEFVFFNTQGKIINIMELKNVQNDKRYSIKSIATTCNRKYIAVGANIDKNNTVIILNLEKKTGRELYGADLILKNKKEFHRHPNMVLDLGFINDNKQIISIHRSGEIKTWDLDGNLIKKNKLLFDIGHACMSPSSQNNNYFAVTDYEGYKIKVYDSNCNLLKIFNNIYRRYSICNQYFAYIGRDDNFNANLKMWDLKNKSMNIFPIGEEYTKSFDGYRSTTFIISHDNKFVIIPMGKNIKIFYLESGICKTILCHDNINNLSLSPDQSKLVISYRFKPSEIRNLDGEIIRKFNDIINARSSFSADNNHLILYDYNHKTSVNRTGKNSYVVEGCHGKIILFNIQKEIINNIDLGREAKSILSILFDPDNKYIISGKIDGKIQFWEFNGKPIKTFNKGKLTESKEIIIDKIYKK